MRVLFVLLKNNFSWENVLVTKLQLRYKNQKHALKCIFWTKQKHHVHDFWYAKRVMFFKGHPPSADLRYGEEDSISPSTLILAAIKG